MINWTLVWVFEVGVLAGLVVAAWLEAKVADAARAVVFDGVFIGVVIGLVISAVLMMRSDARLGW